MPKRVQKYMLAAVVAIILIAVAAVTANKNATTMPSMADMSSSAVSTNSVKIQDYMFNPMVIRVKVGTKVTWTNEDQVHHDVVADTISKDAPNGPLIGQGQSYSFTFNTTGTYMFHCTPHPYMRGTVIVTN